MTICDDLRQSVLQAAIQGKLTQQLPEDGTAADVLASITAEKEQLIKDKKIKKEKPLAPIPVDEIPFDIPDNWVWVRLQTIAQSIVDCPHSTPIYFENETSYCAIDTNCIDEFGNIIKFRYVNQKTYEKRTERLIPLANDIVYTREGSICRAAILPDGKNICLGQRVMLIRSSSGVSVDYLKTILMAPQTVVSLTKMQKGIGAKHINVKDVCALTFPLPPLAEQHRIIARVDELMAKIDELETVEKELVALKKAFPGDMKASLLQAAMQGKLTRQLPEDGSAADLLASIKVEKEQLIKEKKIKKEKPLAPIPADEIPFDIPDNWEWVRLGEIGSFTRGSGIKRTDITESGFPCIRYGELYTTYKGKFSHTVSYTSQEVFQKAFKAQKNDILMALTGENNFDIALARVYSGDNIIAYGGDMTKFTPLKCNAQYIAFVINSAYGIDCKRKMAKGNIIVHISNDNLATIPIPLPPLAEQQRIVEKMDKLLPLCDALKEDGVA